jgi:hypothetical protein
LVGIEQTCLFARQALFVGLQAMEFCPRLRIGFGAQRGELRKLGEELGWVT